MKPTIIDLLNRSVEKYAQNTFLWEKTTDKYNPTTYRETQNQSHLVAAGLISLGVKAGSKVGILSEGRNAWIIGELGILHAGAVSVPLSIKLEESNDLTFRLSHSEAQFILVSGSQLKKIRSIVNDLPLIEKVVIMDEQESYESNEISWNELINLGAAHLNSSPLAVTEVASKIKGHDLANITYTSGTTADPKGVMLTHRNYTANVEQALTLMDVPPHYRTLIILPLDHCFAHVAGFYIFMTSGASVGTVQSGKTGMETLKNIPINIKELKPNILLSVPALAKNFKKNIETGIRAQGPVVNALFNFALKTAYSYNKEGHNRGKGIHIIKKPLLNIFDKIIFSKIREGFGGNLEFFVGGGALLDIDLQRFFYAIGMPMFQGYGLSEATPIISSSGQKRHKLGSSGYLVKPLTLEIRDADGLALPVFEKGEVVIKGENVMAGYFKNEKATDDTIKDGWLHTGDMGYMDDKGFLYVVGRFKSLLISSDGEKYSPEGIEESLVENSHFIDQVILYNSQNPYTSALIVPNHEALKKYAHIKKPHLDWNSSEAKELALNKLQREINEYRKGGKHDTLFPDRWIPAAVAVIAEPFTEQNGLVNSTMKIMRGKVEERYAARIEGLYATGAKNIVNAENIAAITLNN
jgi:long-chain acyl-CoA synthetase